MSAHQTISAGDVQAARPQSDRRIAVAALAAVALYLYAICWPVVPPDMTLFLFPWYEHILEQGPVAAFAEPFSNYTPPYLYLLAAASLADGLLAPLHVIKLLSLAGTAFLAFAVADLLKALGTERKRAAAVFLLPTVILNAALLGQCDAIWAGACVLAIAAMLRGRTIGALAWCGVAIAFKAQSAFLAPVIIGALIGRRAPLWQWAAPAVVAIALMVPAMLRGWPAADLAMVYFRQAEHFDFPGNLANPWIWGTQFAPETAQGVFFLGYAAAAAAALGIGALAARGAGNRRTLVILALVSALALPFLLPKMHERYFFLADVLALAMALAWRDRASIAIAIAVQLASLSAILAYIYNWPAPALAGSFVALAALALLARALHHLATGHHEGNVFQNPDVAKRIA